MFLARPGVFDGRRRGAALGHHPRDCGRFGIQMSPISHEYLTLQTPEYMGIVTLMQTSYHPR